MKSNTYVIIMAGGIGSRFWPYSRNHRPKQFLDVLGAGMSLLQMTYERFLMICPPENIFVVTNEHYSELVKEQLPGLKEEQILQEPERRNTAPCIAYASYKIQEKDPDANIIVAPSDHAVFKEASFVTSIKQALATANKGENLVTIGIKPNRPETGYGYIQYEKGVPGEVVKVKSFTEKPNEEKAKEFIKSGNYFWNAGIFIWNIKSIIRAFENYLPEIAGLFEEGRTSFNTTDEQAFINSNYGKCPNISIDYGIMEKAPNVYVVLSDFGWSDLGSWHALHEIKDKDEQQNVIEANALTYDSDNCMIKGPEDKLIIVQGLKNYLVAECDNVLLICEKDQVHRFSQYLKDVKELKGAEFL
ncbi:mannose-1-phosphate guanylyltransferase [Xanthovirga aplysinae]|uniref:mannose-1-phosphate guanylyltransferase n=1 Tax=Xanthovirga aplysinae TaxID=2529853 RepID=UPI0012BBEF99|nr:mannose-1-phosphate guanylyltransferase [Xanthovirga aplysinae]MTI29886.1 mannose-1-phosphate guanylyltransferase [Xanthovirga aplysinae]